MLSLAECRNITNVGIVRLSKLTLLRRLCLLGCANFNDEGLIDLLKDLTYIEELDLGSTHITGESLREMVILCLNL